MQKIYSYLLQFSGKMHSVCAQLLRQPEIPLSFTKLNLHEDIDQAVIYVHRVPDPYNFGKVSFVKFGPANWESIGNIHRVSNCVFSVSSYILVLRNGWNSVCLLGLAKMFIAYDIVFHNITNDLNPPPKSIAHESRFIRRSTEMRQKASLDNDVSKLHG